MKIIRRFTGLILIAALFFVGAILWNAQQATNTINVNTVAASSVPINPIIAENQKPGTQKWKSPNFDQYINNLMEAERLEHASQSKTAASDSGGGKGAPAAAWTDPQNVKGYASKSSVAVGSQITFQVSSTASQYDLTIYRMGYYGGNGGTEVVSAVRLPGTNRTNPTPDPTTGMIAANWPVSYTLNVPSNWVSGIYMVWLQNVGSNYVAYIPFIVRNDSQTADILYVVATSTWQAYNGWGGKSLYEYNSPEGRALKVSFDRPYDQNDGSGHYYSGDYNMVQWLEHNGYNVTYATSEDLANNPNLMSNRKVFLSDFHDEYYSMEMFNNVKAFRDAGKSLAYFTSNNIYWQIRYENSASGVAQRVIVCYKKETDDPSTSRDPWRTDSDPNKRIRTTVLFRDAPVNMPENQILGVMFDSLVGYGDYRAWTVQNANHWIYQGTGLSNGQTIDKLVGYEWDRIYNNGYSPANMTIIGQTSITSTEGNFLQQAVIWQAPSGAWVLNVSINYWQYFLEGNYIWPLDTRVQRMTINVLNRMISDAGGVVNNTPLPTSTNVPASTNTSTPTTGPSATRTNTPTAGPSSTRTNTPTATNTTAAGATTFYRAINLGGAALTIDGNTWEANTGTTTNFTTNGTVSCNPWQALSPTTDANRTTMITCAQQHWAHSMTMSSVPNGSYQVYVYTWLDWADPNPSAFSISLQGQTVASYTPGPVGHWDRLGPWLANVTAGTITLQTSGGIANLSGLEVYKVGSGGAASATPSRTNTAAPTSTATKTNTPGSGATLTPSKTNTPTRTPTPTITFYKAWNLNGPQYTISSQLWLAGTAGSNGVTVSNGTAFANQNVTLNPTATGNKARLIRTSFNANGTTDMAITIANVPNGSYDVYVTTWEDNASTTFWLALEGGQVYVPSIVSGAAGKWQRLGAYTVNITDGNLLITAGGGLANISGIELFTRK